MVKDRDSDPRYKTMKNRLNKLTILQLKRIIDNDCVYDIFNYDADRHRFCPLATALGVPEILKEKGRQPSQETVRQILELDYNQRR